MNAGEIIKLLSDYNPNDDVLICPTSNRVGHIVGIDHEMMNKKHCIVLRFINDESIVERETFKEKIDTQIQQLEDLKKMVDRKGLVQEVLEIQGLQYRNKKVKDGKKNKTPYDKRNNRTFAQQLCDGFIPTGKRGRPRKIDPSLLSAGIRNLLKPEKIEEMTPTELKDLMQRINDDIEQQERLSAYK